MKKPTKPNETPEQITLRRWIARLRLRLNPKKPKKPVNELNQTGQPDSIWTGTEAKRIARKARTRRKNERKKKRAWDAANQKGERIVQGWRDARARKAAATKRKAERFEAGVARLAEEMQRRLVAYDRGVRAGLAGLPL